MSLVFDTLVPSSFL